MSGKIVLVTGGARSGKSLFAEKYVALSGDKIAYIATSEVLDDEMRFRVKLHQARRPKNWTTYEAPYDAHIAMQEAVQGHQAVLFDCLTLYMSNILCQMPDDEKDYFLSIKEAIDKLIVSAKAGQATVVFVTNEVGSGIVPDNALARKYRDVAGLVNQQVASCADEVYLVVSGLAVDIKKIAVNLA